MKKKILPIILCGGSGSRLWPISRESKPKQFLKLYDDKSLFQHSIERIGAIEEIFIVANKDHQYLIENDILKYDIKPKIIFEPVGRNTCPAVTLAAIQADHDEILLVLSADHYISDSKKFESIIYESIKLLDNHDFIFFGVKPTFPSTEFGYITPQKSSQLIKSFIEKPNEDRAQDLISDGSLWNAGIFMFKRSSFLKYILDINPEMLSGCKKAITKGIQEENKLFVDMESFSTVENISIDYGLMERIDPNLAALVELDDIVWSDLGSWKAIEDLNINQKRNNFFSIDGSNNNFIFSENQLVVTSGVKDLSIISTDDALLIINKNDLTKLSSLVSSMKDLGIKESISFKNETRPWGNFRSLISEPGYQVKRIEVNPYSKLSMQMHYKRSEHWTVVSGQAIVYLNDKSFSLKENESVFIPKESKHSLENTSAIPLVIIEVQCGSYLGEDDIVRFEDRYGRA